MAVSSQDLIALMKRYLLVHDLLYQAPDSSLMNAYRTQYDYRGGVLNSQIKSGTMTDAQYSGWMDEINSFESLARPAASPAEVVNVGGSTQSSPPSGTVSSRGGPGVVDTIAGVFGGIAKGFQTPAAMSFSSGRGVGPGVGSKPNMDWVMYALLAAAVVTFGATAYVVTKRKR